MASCNTNNLPSILWFQVYLSYNRVTSICVFKYLTTPPHEQDVTQGQFLKMSPS